MANTDYTVTLAIEGKEYTATLKKANREMQEMKKHAKSAGSSFGDMGKKLGALATAIGGAKVAMDAFNKLTTDNQTIVDEWGRTMEAAQAVYSGFIHAIGTGDFSTYFNNMKEMVALARDAYDAIDRLASAKIIGGVGVSELDKKIEMYKAMSKSANTEDQIKASKALPELIKQRSQIVNDMIVEERNAGDAMLAEALAKKGYIGDFKQYSDYYTTWEGYNKAGEMHANYQDVKSEFEKWQKYLNSPYVSVEERRMASDKLKVLEPLLESMKTELQKFVSALSEISDEELQAIMAHYIAANNMEQTQFQVQGAANRAINKGIKASASVSAETKKSNLLQIADTTGLDEMLKEEIDTLVSELDYIYAPVINRMNEIMAQQTAYRGWETSMLGQMGSDEGAAKVFTYADALGAVSSAISQIQSATQGMDSGLSTALAIVQSLLGAFTTIFGIIHGASPFGAIGLFGSLFGGSFANGGVVGGTAYTGDRLTASVSSGEMVLTRAQQSNLLAIANGQARGGASEAYVRGDTIYMSLTNYMARTGKSLQ